MSQATVFFMDVRSRRFLESAAIKGRQILEHSGWLDQLKPGDIVAASAKFYPEGVRAKRLKPMCEKNHPLKSLDNASLGKPTEGVTSPKYPKK